MLIPAQHGFDRVEQFGGGPIFRILFQGIRKLPIFFPLDNALAKNIAILAQIRYHPSMIDKHYCQGKEGLCQ